MMSRPSRRILSARRYSSPLTAYLGDVLEEYNQLAGGIMVQESAKGEEGEKKGFH
jgi:hypothetical protein